MGLTATPTYGDPAKRGHLKKLFPRGIIYQVSVQRLMLDEILAKPNFESYSTDITPEWDDRDYELWAVTGQDLPSDIVDELALNRERNAFIAQKYADNSEKYGQTIIFADRWHQCEQILSFLEKLGIKAGAIYSHVDTPVGSKLNGKPLRKRNKDHNDRVLADFRNEEIQVILNVRMLTEGTDVPGAQTVFLTRETKSEILYQQMCGRALRGPKFGGTEAAFIVSFQDQWQKAMRFADYHLFDEEVGDDAPQRPRPPLREISVEMVRQLTRQMEDGVRVDSGGFQSLMPAGWYQPSFEILVPGENNDSEGDAARIETVHGLVLIFDQDLAAFQGLINHLKTATLAEFAGETVVLSDVRSRLRAWQKQFFDESDPRAEERLAQMFEIVRHMAQREGSGANTAPPYLPFEERGLHNIEALVQRCITEHLGPIAKMRALRAEFEREDRFWHAIYPIFANFKSQCDVIENSVLMEQSEE